PERGEHGYLAATIALQSQVRSRVVDLDILYRDKYDRVVACVYVNGRSIDQFMIDNEYARAWRGVQC
ncbi:hypothetical protein LCGC14_2849630, partial [marine sediment metagenome]